MMKKKLYLCVNWEDKSIGVSTKKDWDEYKKGLEEENKCGVNEDVDSVEIYDKVNENFIYGMVELKVDVNYNLVD